MRECCDGAFELASIAYPDGVHLHPERSGRALHRAELARPGHCTESLNERHSLHAIGYANSIDAQRHHQPTRESVRRAEENARRRFAAILARTKILNAEGKTTECLQ
jgi:hypothetical protein